MVEFSTPPAIAEKSGISDTPCMDAREIKLLIGANLRRIREMRGLKSNEAAEMAGLPAGQYSRYENGRGISDRTLAHLCNVFGVDPIEFYRPVRGLGRVSESQEDYQALTDPRLTDRVTVDDDSMAPRYEEGETVYVTRHQKPQDGDYAFVRLNSGETFIRQVHFIRPGVLLLKPLNSHYDPILVDEHDAHLHRIAATKASDKKS